MKKYITKQDIITYLEWVPMEFPFKKAMLLYLIIEFPLSIISFLIFEFSS